MFPSETEIKRVKPIQKQTSLTQMAYEAIREAIVTGRIKPGERMGQVELARLLGVSERTVREAFAQLVAKGLAVHEPYRGVRVTALPLEELREVYMMRALLEGRAVELAAQRLCADELEQMRQLLPSTVALTASSMKSAQEGNHQFHWIPIRASGSRVLQRVLEQLWEMMFAYELLYQDEREIAHTSRVDLAQHEELLWALEARDGEEAAQVVHRHIASTVHSLMARLEGQRSAPEGEGCQENITPIEPKGEENRHGH